MAVFLAILVSLCLIVGCVMVHYETLRLTSRIIPGLSVSTHSKVLVVISGVFLAHIIEISLFALTFFAMQKYPAFGTIAGQFSGTGLDFFYFSITNYTTLGVGDLFTHGQLRLVAGIEALTGFVLIGWSASFAYLAMEKFWDQHGRKPAP